MASKPLHVRRLQKALQEWITNPCTVYFSFFVLVNSFQRPKIKAFDITKKINNLLKLFIETFLAVAALFQTPVVPTTTSSCKNPSSASFTCASPRPQQQQQQQQTSTTIFSGISQQSTTMTPVTYSSSHIALTPLPCRSASPVTPVANVAAPVATTTYRHSPSPNAPIGYTASHSPGVLQVRYYAKLTLSDQKFFFGMSVSLVLNNEI